jgi:hypothetical protein
MKPSTLREMIHGLVLVALLSTGGWATHNPISSTRTGIWVGNLQDIQMQFINTNANGTRYFFMASVSNSEPLNTNQPTDVTNGNLVIDSLDYFGPGTAQMLTKDISPVGAGRTYFIYVEACEPGTAYTLGLINTGVCSNWVLISGSQATLPLSTNPGFQTISKTNVTSPSSVVINLSNPALSEKSAQNWFVTFTQSGVPANTSGKLGNPFGSGVGPYTLTVDDAYFAGQAISFRFSPNTAYILGESMFYKYNQETNTYTPPTTPFWTNPVDPVIVSTTPTHFTVTVAFNSHGTGADNPSGTVYRTQIVGPGGSSFDTTYSGTNPMSHKFTGLQAGTPYQACVTAQNLGGTNWNPSGTVCKSFTTLPINPTYSVTGVQTNQATFNVTLNPPTGITDYIVERCVGGVSGTCVQDVKKAWPQPNASIASTMGSLTPNTAYQFYIQFFEGLDNSAYSPQPDQGQGVNQFTTTPAVPTPTSFTAPTARQLAFAWGANGNPNGTTYEINYSLTSNFSTGVTTVTTTASSLTVNDGGSTPVSPETAYYARIFARNVTRPTWPDSAYANFSGPVTTPNENPTITSMSCATPVGSATTCDAQANDNGPKTDLRCVWSVNNGAAVTSGSPGDADASGNCPQVAISFPANNTYTVTLEVRDHQGVPVYLTATANRTVVVGPQPKTVTVTPNPQTVATGDSKTFTASVYDQFDQIIPGAQVNWTKSGTGDGTLSTTFGPSTNFTGTVPGAVTLTATIASVSGNASITVVAAGPYFMPGGTPKITLRLDGKSADLSANANDNVYGEPTYTWSLERGPGALQSVVPNGTTSARSAVVTFTMAGTYVLRCTLNNQHGGTASDVTPSLTVPPNLSKLTVSPSSATVKITQLQQFTAAGIDQFGQSMVPADVKWSVIGSGIINGAGVFSSNAIGTQVTVMAKSGDVPGYAVVTLVSFDVSAAKAYPVPFKSTLGSAITFAGLGNDVNIRIYTTSGRLVFSTHVTPSDGIFNWNVRNSSGESLASGVYFYVIESLEGKKDGKLIIIQ